MSPLFISYTVIVFILLFTPLFFNAHVLLNYLPPKILQSAGSAFSAVTNSILFLSLTVLFGIILLLLLKKPVLLRYILISLILYITFSVSFYYLSLITIITNLSFSIMMLLSFMLTLIILISLIKNIHVIYSMCLLIIMIGLGVIFHFLIDIPTEIGILLVYSLFDYLSVSKGFLKRMFEAKGSSVNPINLLVVKIGKFGIGTGDIVFYSMLLCLGMSLYSIYGYLTTLVCLLIGHTLNLALLRNFKIIPALPIPVILTLASLYILSLI